MFARCEFSFPDQHQATNKNGAPFPCDTNNACFVPGISIFKQDHIWVGKSECKIIRDCKTCAGNCSCHHNLPSWRHQHLSFCYGDPWTRVKKLKSIHCYRNHRHCLSDQGNGSFGLRNGRDNLWLPDFHAEEPNYFLVVFYNLESLHDVTWVISNVWLSLTFLMFG